MLACRNTRPGVVQRWPTNRSPAVRSVRRWKPRSLTSKPGVVVLSAKPEVELAASVFARRSEQAAGSRPAMAHEQVSRGAIGTTLEAQVVDLEAGRGGAEREIGRASCRE